MKISMFVIFFIVTSSIPLQTFIIYNRSSDRVELDISHTKSVKSSKAVRVTLAPGESFSSTKDMCTISNENLGICGTFYDTTGYTSVVVSNDGCCKANPCGALCQRTCVML